MLRNLQLIFGLIIAGDSAKTHTYDPQFTREKDTDDMSVTTDTDTYYSCPVLIQAVNTEGHTTLLTGLV